MELYLLIHKGNTEQRMENLRYVFFDKKETYKVIDPKLTIFDILVKGNKAVLKKKKYIKILPNFK